MPEKFDFHVFFEICVFDIFTKKYEPDWVESDWTRLGMDLNRIEPDWVGIGTGSNRIGFFRSTNRIEPVLDPEGNGFGRNRIEPTRNMPVV